MENLVIDFNEDDEEDSLALELVALDPPCREPVLFLSLLPPLSEFSQAPRTIRPPFPTH